MDLKARCLRLADNRDLGGDFHLTWLCVRAKSLLSCLTLCPWDSPGKNAGLGCCALLQGIFPTQGLNLCLLHLPALAGGFFNTSTTCCCCYWCKVTSVVSDSVRPHRRQPTRLPRPWDTPGKNSGVGCHFLLQCMKVKSESEVAQSCLTCSDPKDCSPPGSSVHGIFQARGLEWGAIEHHLGRANYSTTCGTNL